MDWGLKGGAAAERQPGSWDALTSWAKLVLEGMVRNRVYVQPRSTVHSCAKQRRQGECEKTPKSEP